MIQTRSRHFHIIAITVQHVLVYLLLAPQRATPLQQLLAMPTPALGLPLQVLTILPALGPKLHKMLFLPRPPRRLHSLRVLTMRVPLEPPKLQQIPTLLPLFRLPLRNLHIQLVVAMHLVALSHTLPVAPNHTPLGAPNHTPLGAPNHTPLGAPSHILLFLLLCIQQIKAILRAHQKLHPLKRTPLSIPIPLQLRLLPSSTPIHPAILHLQEVTMQDSQQPHPRNGPALVFLQLSGVGVLSRHQTVRI